MEQDIQFEKWQHQTLSDDDLKRIAKDLADNNIFTDRHLGKQTSLLPMVFMPLTFIGCSERESKSRKEAIANVLKDAAKEEYFKSIGKTEEEARTEYLKNIGLIYEYYDKAGPCGINGFPIFFSMSIVSSNDTEKLFNYYEKYIEIKKRMENEFSIL